MKPKSQGTWLLKESTSRSQVPYGYRMPAEWEPHEATWLAWPNVPAWSAKKLKSIRLIFLRIVEILLEGEKVHLLIASQKEKDKILAALKHARRLDRLIFHLSPAEDIWIRDYGPVFIKNKAGKKAWCKWRFNAWGGKYKALVKDDKIFSRRLIPNPCFRPPMVLEGGSIDVNGRGMGLTSEQCLLNPNRNPHLSRFEIESYLKKFLGIEKVIWLARGIAGDDTDGHIDQLARFVNTRTILASYEENPADENYANLKENWKRLERFKEESGKSLKLVRLPMPDKVVSKKKRLPASYANFYIANKAIFLPVFGRPKDKRAIAILKEHFPIDWKIVPIPSGDLIYGFGGIHCMTHEEPK